jgi:hypothetical protein
MQRSRGDAENGAIASAGANYASGRGLARMRALAVTATLLLGQRRWQI